MASTENNKGFSFTYDDEKFSWKPRHMATALAGIEIGLQQHPPLSENETIWRLGRVVHHLREAANPYSPVDVEEEICGVNSGNHEQFGRIKRHADNIRTLSESAFVQGLLDAIIVERANLLRDTPFDDASFEGEQA
jgi:hypothetical protein